MEAGKQCPDSVQVLVYTYFWDWEILLSSDSWDAQNLNNKMSSAQTSLSWDFVPSTQPPGRSSINTIRSKSFSVHLSFNDFKVIDATN